MDLKHKKILGMVNLCCMCEIEMPVQPKGVRHGYCSESCWNRWLKENKDNTTLMPYVPMQLTRITWK